MLFKLTSNTKDFYHNGEKTVLGQIECIQNTETHKVGELGGWINPDILDLVNENVWFDEETNIVDCASSDFPDIYPSISDSYLSKVTVLGKSIIRNSSVIGFNDTTSVEDSTITDSTIKTYSLVGSSITDSTITCTEINHLYFELAESRISDSQIEGVNSKSNLRIHYSVLSNLSIEDKTGLIIVSSIVNKGSILDGGVIRNSFIHRSSTDNSTIVDTIIIGKSQRGDETEFESTSVHDSLILGKSRSVNGYISRSHVLDSLLDCSTVNSSLIQGSRMKNSNAVVSFIRDNCTRKSYNSKQTYKANGALKIVKCKSWNASEFAQTAKLIRQNFKNVLTIYGKMGHQEKYSMMIEHRMEMISYVFGSSDKTFTLFEILELFEYNTSMSSNKWSMLTKYFESTSKNFEVMLENAHAGDEVNYPRISMDEMYAEFEESEMINAVPDGDSKYYERFGVEKSAVASEKTENNPLGATVKSETANTEREIVPHYAVIEEESKMIHGRTVYRIRALRDITYDGKIIAKTGDLGGWVESFSRNALSKDESLGTPKKAGKCSILLSEDTWVMDEAVVFNGSILKKSLVKNSAIITGHISDSVIGGNAQVGVNASIMNSVLAGDVRVYGESRVADSELSHGVVYNELIVKNRSSHKTSQNPF